MKTSLEFADDAATQRISRPLHGIVKRLVCWSKDKMRRCSHEGCWAKGRECYLPDNPGPEPSEWVCGEHSHAAGYCWGCGQFQAGIESFDFSKSGLCGYCDHQWKTEAGEYDSDEDEPDYYPYPDA